MNRLTDCHCHSDNSFDAKDSVAKMASTAQSLGLYAFCITDHCDLYVPGQNKNAECFDGDMLAPILRSVNQMKEYRENAAGDTKLLCGIELGQASQDPEKAKEILQSADFDFVLGSLHNLACEEDFFFMQFDKLDTKEILTRYFNELIDICTLGMFDSLAHITYPIRYIIGKYKIAVNIDDYKPLTDKILTMLVKSGKAFELNTSPIRNNIDVIGMDKKLLARYKALGGEYVTVGSDAHNTHDIASDIPTAYDIIRSVGIDRVTIFEKRKPITIKI